jgi:DNA-binding CsgD family transcriptional regulator
MGQVTMSELWAPLPSLPMSPRELLVVCMFCEGMRTSEVTESLGLTIFTVRSYVKRARQRYANAGRPATNVLLLRQRLVEDGHLAY